MSQDSIKVVCRLRPLNKIQIANDGVECVSYSEKDITLAVGGQQNKYTFAFDKIFGPRTQQVSIYKEVAIPVIKSVISGFNSTIFAYGQTGGGKTWTMEEGPSHTDSQFKGLIPRTIQGLFQGIQHSEEDIEFLIKCSYIEIYNEKLNDLLDPSKARLDIKQDKQRGVFIQNCSQICVSSPQEMLLTMDKGSQNRRVAFTGMNQRSSRSHSLFIIHVNQKNLKKNNTKASKLYFVDLAGSQKVGKTGCVGQQLEQAKNINKSLSALGNVINALTSDKKQHVPYRDSKLTRILQQSLGGNSKTTLIINCSMCTYNDKQTLSTLRFGYRAKSIKNKPKVNQQKSAKQLMILLQAANKTIAQLKTKLNGGISIEKQGEGQMKQTNDSAQKLQLQETIKSLKQQIQAQKQEQQQRNKEMQQRIKQLLVQNTREKAEKQQHLVQCKGTFRSLNNHLNTVYKFIKRSYFDLQYMMNNVLVKFEKSKIQSSDKEKSIDSAQDSSIDNESSKDLFQKHHLDETKKTMESTFQNIEEFIDYFEKSIKPILNDIQVNEQKKEKVRQSQLANNCIGLSMSSPKNQDKKRIKINFSEPILFPQDQNKDGSLLISQNQQLQMSCIVQQQPTQQNSQSDKISGEGSLSEIETFLESLETKESHKYLIEEMTSSMKSLKKQNQQLKKSIEKLIQQKISIASKVQQALSEKISDLQERIDEYKSIMTRKDIQLADLLQKQQKGKQIVKEERIVNDRLKKIIEESNTMKKYADMEQRVRALGAERQKLYNQMYKLRGQLDEAEINVKQKEEHIQSLKSVMLQLEEQIMEKAAVNSSNYGDINKVYNAQYLGNELPNVIKTVKGGSKSKNHMDPEIMSSIPNPKSSLRRKMHMQQNETKQGTNRIVPFIKSFFV